MSVADLLAVVCRALGREGTVAVSVRHAAADALWVRVDSHALARALAQRRVGSTTRSVSRS